MTLSLHVREITHVRGEGWGSGWDTCNCSGFDIPEVRLNPITLL